MIKTSYSISVQDKVRNLPDAISDAVSLKTLVLILLAIAIGLSVAAWSITTLFLVVAGVVLVATVYLKPEYVLYVFIILVIITTETISNELRNAHGILLFEDMKLVQGVPPITTAMLLLLFFVYFSKRFLVESRNSLIPFKYLLVYVALLLVALIVGVRNGFTYEDIKIDFVRFICPAFCFFLGVNILDDTKKNLWVVWIVFASCFIKAVIMDFNYLSGHGEPYEDYAVVTLDSAVLMADGIMISLVCAFILHAKKPKGLSIMLLGLLPMAFAIVFSLRRAHWVGQIASLTILYLWCRTVQAKKRLLTALVCALLALFTYMTVYGQLSDAKGNSPDLSSRIESIFDPTQSSNEHHYLEFMTTLQDILQRPVLAMGLGGVHSPVTGIDWPEESQPLQVVHNTFIYIWMKLGLPGLLFFIWAGAMFIKKLSQYLKVCHYNQLWPYIAGIGSGTGIWIIMFITGPVPWYLHQTTLIALLSAVCINLIRLKTNEHNGA